MAKIYFTHKLSWGRHETLTYEYSDILQKTYKWYLDNGVFTFQDLVRVDNKYKSKYWFDANGIIKRWIGTINDEWLAVIDIDDSKLSACGKDISILQNKIEWHSLVELQILTNAEALSWMRSYTDYAEEETGKFLVHEAEEGLYPENVYLIID